MSEVDVDISAMSMVDLFRIEVEQQAGVLTEGLLAIEKGTASSQNLEAVMRAAHSIKGAARLVSCEEIVKIVHKVEDCLALEKQTAGRLNEADVDVLLRAVDMLLKMSTEGQTDTQWLKNNEEEINTLEIDLGTLCKEEKNTTESPQKEQPNSDEKIQLVTSEAVAMTVSQIEAPRVERVLRVTTKQFDRLMALAGESLLQNRWLRPCTETLRRLRREQWALVSAIEDIREQVKNSSAELTLPRKMIDIQYQAIACRNLVEQCATELESFDIRTENLSKRLHGAVINSRMRPFKDGVEGLPRIVRDLAKSLGKKIDMTITGHDTKVDRDILERIESSLVHLLNNAIDHGIENPKERLACGKPEIGCVTLNALHCNGMLFISVNDDGRGINYDTLRQQVVYKGLVGYDVAQRLNHQELSEFLFLPAFSTKDKVTAISGRGVGLDIVRDVLNEMRGSIEISSKTGMGTLFKMRLPLTLSIVSALIVTVADEPYAIPLTRIDRVLRVPLADIQHDYEGQVSITIDEKCVDLVVAAEVLELPISDSLAPIESVIVLSDKEGVIAFSVDGFVTESSIVVQAVPELFGKIQDIESGAILEDGSPALVVDVDDILQSARRHIVKGSNVKPKRKGVSSHHSRVKRVLVVDDSITVRELIRKLLIGLGYEVDVAVDGMEGWHAVRNCVYDLVITDVDMPRLNGFQLVSMIKQEPTLASTQVMVVTYKDRDEDQTHAFDVGADGFLAKAKFHDDTLRNEVVSLIGESGS